uniref:Condensin complex subunit 2 n=1 Tax=Triticum urartu TaxID=4572 RepID=A0A8R7QVZ7_TRIUA
MPPAEDASAAAPPRAPTPPPARGMAAGSRLLLQSPPPAFPLGSNDDQLERARARAMARAASVRRRSLAASLAPKTPHPDLLNRDEVMDLFHNCIKLASENVRASPTVRTIHRSWISPRLFFFLLCLWKSGRKSTRRIRGSWGSSTTSARSSLPGRRRTTRPTSRKLAAR